jgi:WD40 repeat protein
MEMLLDGRLASSSWDKSIKIWDLSQYKCVATLIGHEGIF